MIRVKAINYTITIIIAMHSHILTIIMYNCIYRIPILLIYIKTSAMSMGMEFVVNISSYIPVTYQLYDILQFQKLMLQYLLMK